MEILVTVDVIHIVFILGTVKEKVHTEEEDGITNGVKPFDEVSSYNIEETFSKG